MRAKPAAFRHFDASPINSYTRHPTPPHQHNCICLLYYRSVVLPIHVFCGRVWQTIAKLVHYVYSSRWPRDKVNRDTSREVNEAKRPHTCSRPRVFEEKKNERKTKKSAAPKTHHGIHSSPATATTWRRHATKHVPRVSPYSPASIDPGFVEIGFVQLSQSVKTTDVTHRDRQTN